MNNQFSIITKDTEETVNIAKSISTFFEVGDIILVNGDIAVGKTYFIKGFISGFNYNQIVKSPSYTIVNFHRTIDFDILHIDLYKENSINYIIQNGIFEYFQKCIVIIERGDLFSNYIKDYFFINILFYNDINNSRQLTFSYKGKKYLQKYSSIMNQLINP